MWCSDREDTFHSVVVIDVWCLNYMVNPEETLKGPFQVRGWSVLCTSKARILQDVCSFSGPGLTWPERASCSPVASQIPRDCSVGHTPSAGVAGTEVNVPCLHSEKPSHRAACETTGGVPFSLRNGAKRHHLVVFLRSVIKGGRSSFVTWHLCLTCGRLLHAHRGWVAEEQEETRGAIGSSCIKQSIRQVRFFLYISSI